MAIEDETIIETMEKDFLKYKGKVVEDFSSFLYGFIDKNVSPFEFEEDIKKNAKFPSYVNLKDVVSIYEQLYIY